MTSDEKLVAQAAKELLEASPAIDQLGQIAIGTDQEDLQLPCTVISAKLNENDPRAALPREYDLSVELRSLARVHDESAVDETFAAIDRALLIAPATWPLGIITSVFGQFIIENQTGSDHTAGDVTTRSATYRAFAKLL